MTIIFWAYRPVHWTGFIVGRVMRAPAKAPASVRAQTQHASTWWAVRSWHKTDRAAQAWLDANGGGGWFDAQGTPRRRTEVVAVAGTLAVAYRRVRAGGALTRAMQVVWRKGGVTRCRL